VQREGDFGSDEIADENTDYVSNPFSKLSTILRIQQAPPGFVAMPRPFRRRSPYFALDAQMLSIFPINFTMFIFVTTLLSNCD
jgi:hypothetical protein